MTARPAFELADVFRRHGETYAQLNAGHLGRVERRVTAAIAACRTAALGGHVEPCDDCGLKPSPTTPAATRLGARIGLIAVLHT